MTQQCRDISNYYYNKNIAFLCLQDTHLCDSDQPYIRSIWPGELILHSKKTNSQGVAIFFNNNFEFSIYNFEKDNDSNLLMVDLTISDISRLIIIYGLN